MLLPNPAHNAPYRLSLSASSANPSTYLGVLQLTYTTDLHKCGHEQSGSTKKAASTSTTPTTSIAPTRNLNCDFETGTLCNWRTSLSQGSTTLFQLGTPLNASIPTLYRPYSDHTTQSTLGHFTYLFNLRLEDSQTAILQASNSYPNKVVCFTFAYYFFAIGRVPASFNLTMDSSEENVIIFRAYGANEITWRKAAFTVTPTTLYNTFTFRANVIAGEPVMVANYHRFSAYLFLIRCLGY